MHGVYAAQSAGGSGSGGTWCDDATDVKKAAAAPPYGKAVKGNGKCPFRLAVINDEITQDFEKACQIVAGDFGLHWIELRSMWNKNVTELNAKEVEDAQEDSRRTQTARDRYREPAFQDRLAGRSAIVAERNARPVSCGLRRQRAGQAAGATASSLARLSTPTAFAASITGGWMIRSRTARRSTPNCSRLRNAAPKIM